jgi:iron complex outermembrane receptor protein
MRGHGTKIKTVCFKQWTRKKFSAMVSLSCVIKIGVLCLAYSLVTDSKTFAQTDSTSVGINVKEIPEVEVTGRRSQVVSSEISRMVTVIRKEEVERAGIQSIVDLLEYVSNLDIRQRGTTGVQADISMRGSSFDHVMVMVNGIGLNDPQTGHLSLDIPIDYEIVERIEVLEGPSARTLGPGAFMGAVNIITNSGFNNEIAASQTFGAHNFTRTHLHAGFGKGPMNHFLSVSRASSDGYMTDTDFSLYNVYYRGQYNYETTSLDVQGGYQDKHFGAAGFYSPRFPNQYEETGTWFGSVKATTGGRLKVSPVFYWRRKNDHFLLNRDNPAFYENYHLNNLYGSQLNFTYQGRIGITTLGFDLKSEGIFSNNIGYPYGNPKPVPNTDSTFYTKQYSRTNFASFLEYIFTYKSFTVTTGAMINWNSGFHDKPSVFPGMDISCRLSGKYTLYASINRALHLPTFTDLFYTDPLNQGNSNLDPNRLISYEGGAKMAVGKFKGRIAGFYNNGRDIVDWLWSYKTSKFSPLNLSRYEATGLTAGMSFDLLDPHGLGRCMSHISVNFITMTINKSAPDSVSKYYNLKNKLSVVLSQQLSQHLTLAWDISYQDRDGEAIGYSADKGYYPIPYKPYWIMDLAIKWKWTHVNLFTEVTNILNTRYIDAGSVLQPLRWFKAGVLVQFGT